MKTKVNVGFLISPETVRLLREYKKHRQERASPGEVITLSSAVDRILWEYLKKYFGEKDGGERNN